ncbi:hypothetical protein O6H91_Y102000 [Diphasiastrum complanatum]|nr:hypothetical protein O6H91_Y102000 [Diphasiastrum complanatum]
MITISVSPPGLVQVEGPLLQPFFFFFLDTAHVCAGFEPGCTTTFLRRWRLRVPVIDMGLAAMPIGQFGDHYALGFMCGLSLPLVTFWGRILSWLSGWLGFQFS